MLCNARSVRHAWRGRFHPPPASASSAASSSSLLLLRSLMNAPPFKVPAGAPAIEDKCQFKYGINNGMCALSFAIEYCVSGIKSSMFIACTSLVGGRCETVANPCVREMSKICTRSPPLLDRAAAPGRITSAYPPSRLSATLAWRTWSSRDSFASSVHDPTRGNVFSQLPNDRLINVVMADMKPGTLLSSSSAVSATPLNSTSATFEKQSACASIKSRCASVSSSKFALAISMRPLSSKDTCAVCMN